MIHSVSAFIAILAVASALSRSSVLKPFSEGNAFKVIAGLNNFDASIVKNVVSAACSGGASHVDLACDANLVRLAKSISSDMPICVSSIKPIDFVAAVEAGADMIEIGNFDGFYEQGLKFTAEDVIAMTIETRSLLPNIPLSVTVPHTLSLSEQVALAIRLEECGADIIQTEGKMSVSPSSMGVQEMIEKAAPTLAAGDYFDHFSSLSLSLSSHQQDLTNIANNFPVLISKLRIAAFAISRAVSIPVMCASGLNDVTAPLALAAGARGVGIGSMVNKLPNSQQVLTYYRYLENFWRARTFVLFILYDSHTH